MPTTLEVGPDVASKIAARARALGVSVDAYLRTLVEGDEAEAERRPSLSPQEKARLWREWADSHDPDTPSLSDEAISRESIYGERG